VAPDMDFDTLVAEAEQVSPGSEGLIYLPYLSGERTPHPDPYARGAWIGLTIRHERAHMTRSVLEGVAFGLKDSFELIRQAGLGSIDQVRVSGGGAKSQLWKQILADTLDVELVTVNTTEGAAYGAALLAGVGAGMYGSVLEACQQMISITGNTRQSGNQDAYREYYPQYRALYPMLADQFKALADFSDAQSPGNGSE
jgi:xylulokinase